MEDSKLELHLAEGEGMTVEFKRCGALPTADFFETVC